MFKASSKWLGYLVDVIALCAGSDAEWICFKWQHLDIAYVS